MSEKDYYAILGVSKDASQDDIKTAYRQLARKYHPDVNPGKKDIEEKFKDINEAFSVLSDPQKRAQYDQYGSAAFRPEDVAGFREFKFNFDDLFSDFGFGDIFDVFRRGGGERRPRTRQGADIRYDLEITLEEAFSGLDTKVEIPLYVMCSKCNGTGAEPGFLRPCPKCKGTGEIRKIQKRGFMQMMNITACDKCGGRGNIIEKNCDVCNGTGQIAHVRKISIKVPAGIDDGAYLRVPGQGEAGEAGGPQGDLYVLVHIKPHPIFERYESNLLCRVTIPLTYAIFGSEVPVKTITGKAKIKIPPGTQSHSVFRLKGQGMPIRDGDRGDQLVKIVVAIPMDLSKKQRELLQEYAQEESRKLITIETGRGFFEQFKIGT